MKHTIAFVALLSFFSFSFARIPELHDTTIAVFPNTNPGDSLRFRELFYDGTTEKLECYAIGKTIFPFKSTSTPIPEFDSAKILVSDNLKNIMDTVIYNNLAKSFPSIARTDTETIIRFAGAGDYGSYCQCHKLAIVFSFFPKKIAGVGSGQIDCLRPPLVVRDIFEAIRAATPITTKIASRGGSIISKNIKNVSSRRFLVNGRAISSMNQHSRIISNRLISRGF